MRLIASDISIIDQRAKLKIPPPPALLRTEVLIFHCSSNTDCTGIRCYNERPLGVINRGNTQLNDLDVMSKVSNVGLKKLENCKYLF